MIGLELSWERLVRMRRLVFGLGLAQVLISTAILAEIGYFWFGLKLAPAILMGAGLGHVVHRDRHARARGDASARQGARAAPLFPSC